VGIKRSGGTRTDGSWRDGLYLPRTDPGVELPSSDEMLTDVLATVDPATARDRFREMPRDIVGVLLRNLGQPSQKNPGERQCADILRLVAKADAETKSSFAFFFAGDAGPELAAELRDTSANGDDPAVAAALAVERVISRSDADAVRLAALAALTSATPEDVPIETMSDLLGVVLLDPRLTLEPWKSIAEGVPPMPEFEPVLPTEEGVPFEKDLTELAETFSDAVEATEELTEKLRRGVAPTAERLARVQRAADRFDQIVADLSVALNEDVEAKDLPGVLNAITRLRQRLDSDPELAEIRRLANLDGDSDVVEELEVLAELLDEEDLELRAGLLALVQLFDAHEADDDGGIDAAEQTLGDVEHSSVGLLRRARRDILRGRLIIVPLSENAADETERHEPVTPVEVASDPTGEGPGGSDGPKDVGESTDELVVEPEPTATATERADANEAGPPEHEVTDGEAPIEAADPADRSDDGGEIDATVEPLDVELAVVSTQPDVGEDELDVERVAEETAVTADASNETEITSTPAPNEVDDPEAEESPVVASEVSSVSDDGDGTAIVLALESLRPGLASWIARAESDDLLAHSLRCVALADAMRSSTGPSASAFRDEVTSLGADELSRPPVRLLLAAAGTRVALLSPYAGPVELLGKLAGNLDGLPALAQLVDAFSTAAQRGVQIVGDVTSAVRSAAADEAALAAIIADAQEQIDHSAHRTNRYHAATVVWQQWMKADGLLGTILTAVTEDDRRRVVECARAIVALGDRTRLDREIANADRRATRRDQIIGPAKQALYHWTERALATAGAWIDLVSRLEAEESDRHSGAWQAGPLADLRASASELRDSVMSDLDRQRMAAEPLTAAAAGLAYTCIAQTLRLLLDGEPLAGEELPPQDSLNRHLLLSPTGSLSPDWDHPSTLGDLNAAATVPRGLDGWIGAFRSRAEIGEHVGTLRILKLIESRDAGAAVELTKARDKGVIEWRDRVRSLRADTRKKLESSRRHGYLDEDAWSRYSAVWEATDPDKRDDLGAALTELETVQQQLAETKSRKLEEFNERFESACDGGLVKGDAARRIQDRIESGDLATADEYLAIVSEGMELPRPSRTEGVIRLEAFDPSPAAELAASDMDRRAVKAAADGGKWGSLDFDWLDEASRRSVSNALATWRDLVRGTRHETYWPALTPVLELLGIEAADIRRPRGLKSSQDRVWLELSGVRRTGRSMVPDFGSYSGGPGVSSRMLVMLVFGGKTPEVVSEWVTAEPTLRPVLVLYVGNLTPDERRRFARTFRPVSRRRPVVIVDTSLLVYLGATGGQSFESTMRLTLPFSAISPYLPGVAGLVPTEMFYGRDDELRALLSPHGSSFVYGGRQLGKSALLRAAQRQFDNGPDRRAVYLDLKGLQIGVRNGRNPQAIWAVLWSELAELGVTRGDPPARDVDKNLEDAVKAWLGEDEGRALLVLLDECDPLLEADGENGFMTVSRLKTLMESEGRRVKFVFAGLHRVQRYDRVENHPLAHLGSPIAVGPLRPQAAADLVSIPMEALGYRFEDPELVSRIIAVCNNQPSLIVLFMKSLVDTLLARDWSDSPAEPPVTITESDVEETYLSEALAEQIRYRFDLTLGLDPAYKVIAYTLAFLCRMSRPDLVVPEAELRRHCADYWPAGFGGMGNDAFRALCDEMIGLGVLNKSADGLRLRSPNVLRLLGTDDQIEETLLEAGDIEPGDRYDPSAHRALLTTDGRRESSPLSAAQVADLLAPRNQVRVVIGAPAGGLELVHAALETSRPEALHMTSRRASDRGATGAFSAGGSARHTVAFIDLESVDLDRSRRVLEQASRSRRGSVGVVLLAGPDQHRFWRHCVANSTDVEITELSRLDDDALRAVFTEIDQPLADSARRQVLDVTGGWWSLLQIVIAGLQSGNALGQAIDSVAAHLEGTLGREFVRSTGVAADPTTARAFDELVALAPDDEPAELLAELIGVGQAGAKGAAECIELMRILGALERTPSGGLTVEPVLADVWRAVQE